MNDSTNTRSIVAGRTMSHPPEKVRRALTQSCLIAGWLMESDFEARFGVRFQFRGGCVRSRARGSAPDSVVQWPLSAGSGGTRVRMEHAVFGPRSAPANETMSGGRPRVLERLEQVSGTGCPPV